MMRRLDFSRRAVNLFAAVGAAGAISAAAAPRQVETTPTFAREIAPIIFDNCSECHRAGQAGPFSLLTYDDVRRRAREIAQVTSSRFMPPWLPEEGFGEFAGERRLSEQQIELIGQWVEGGAPEGESRETPPAPAWSDGWALGPPDLALAMTEPFALRADGSDVYRNFVIEVPIEQTVYVRGWEFRPGNARVVHHAFVLVDRSGNARALDAKDPEPGYDGMLEAEVDGLDGFINGWAPGKGAVMEREGMAWRLEPGDDLVLQIHMQPSGKPEQVHASIGLYLADAPPTLHPAIVYLGSRSIDVPPGESRHLIEDSFLLPADVDVLAIVPHAHYVARQMRCWATLPDGSRTWLIRIDDWDFNWQGTFTYAQPVFLPRASRITAQFTYDNSESNPRNPNYPPQRVRYGPNSTDEMCEMWLQVLPRDAADLPRIERSVAEHFADVIVEGLEHLVQREPEDIEARHALAMRHRMAGNIAKAIVHFRRITELQPDSDEASRELADALAQRGRTTEALGEYERSLELNASDETARFNYANTLRRARRLEEAIAQYRLVLQRNAESVEARHNLAVTLEQSGLRDEAVAQLREIVRIQPAVALHHYSLGAALLRNGEAVVAVEQMERAVELDPLELRPKLHLAWVLATHPQEDVRDGTQSLALAQQAESIAPSDPHVLDTLAAAYAELGRFDHALQHAQEALRLAREEQQKRYAEQILERLASYRRGEPHREE